MQAVSVQTTQNIQLDYPLASLGDRILGYLIDLAIMLSYGFLMFMILSSVGLISTASFIAFSVIPGMTYRMFAEILFNGQSVGKKALNIKVIKLDGSTPSIGSYILRWLLEPIEILAFVGLSVLVIILNPNGQRLGDILAGTTVVKIKHITTTNVRNKIIMKEVDENYVATYPEAEYLTDKEIKLIKSVLAAFREDTNSEPLNLIVEKLKNKYHIQTEEAPVKFLYTLLRDHTYYVSQ